MIIFNIILTKRESVKHVKLKSRSWRLTNPFTLSKHIFIKFFSNEAW